MTSMENASWCPTIRGSSRLEAPSGTRPYWMKGDENVALVLAIT
jgi:hypothetical protein